MKGGSRYTKEKLKKQKIKLFKPTLLTHFLITIGWPRIQAQYNHTIESEKERKSESN